VKRLRSWTEEVRKWRGEVTNLKRNSSLTAVNRCKNPNLQKRLGFSFCTFQVLKWRSGLTRVVSTYTYAVPLSTTSVPTPSKHSHPVTTITRKNTTQCPEVVSTYTYAVSLSAISNTTPISGQSHKRFMVKVVEEKRRFMNDPTHLGFNRSNRGQSGTDTPLPYPREYTFWTWSFCLGKSCSELRNTRGSK